MANQVEPPDASQPLDGDGDTATRGGPSTSWAGDLRWKLILSLGAVQVVPASLALFNLYPRWIEYLVGTVLAIAWVAVLRLRRVNRPFLSGFFVGLTAGLVTAVVQGTFVRVYLRYHPDLLQTNPDAPTVAWAASIVGVSLLGGLVAGLITGGLAWLASRFGRWRTVEAPA